MASSVIHMCVAKEINKKIMFDEKLLLLGAIAPDISKIMKQPKKRTHFLDHTRTGIPNMKKFLNKYQKHIADPFVMGYYIHLYTDLLWFRYFITEISKGDQVRLLDGNIINCKSSVKSKIIYEDYANMNLQLIDAYDLTLSLFYEPLQMDTIWIEEVSKDQIPYFLDQVSLPIKNATQIKPKTFNLENTEKFIHISADLIYGEIVSLLHTV